MRTRWLALPMVLMCALAFCPRPVSAEDAGDSAVFELRTYTTFPGKLPALHKRFRDHTMRIFKKHGMINVMYFTPVDKENTLVYLLKHKSQDAAKKSWAAFRQDPEWKKVAEESQKDGKIVMKVQSVFLNPTDYSPRPLKEKD